MPVANANYEKLKQIKTKEFEFYGYKIYVHFNPARAVSSLAKLDAKSIAERPCFLCPKNRIEGQVRGIRGMVEKEAYCTDILTQVSAVQSALNAFSRELLSSHIRTCVADGIRADDTEVVDELVRTVEKLMK